VREFIDESIRNFQAALRNSQIGATARLVHARRHNQFPEDGMTADMNRMNRCEIRNLCQLRDTHRAHVTVALTLNRGVRGNARMGPDPRFRSTTLGPAATTWTIAHEVGHIMGCRDDRHGAGGCGSSETWFGHRTSDFRWRDIMSHECNLNSDSCSARVTRRCEMMPHYGDPNIRFNGIRTGSAQNNCAARIRSGLNTLMRAPTCARNPCPYA
jgi:hypothetical protein